jgi:hypothetical protein
MLDHSAIKSLLFHFVFLFEVLFVVEFTVQLNVVFQFLMFLFPC